MTRTMAEEAIKKLEEQLNCSICLDTYTDPKLLRCFHVYCQKCLVPLVDRNHRGQLCLTCPVCRQVTRISKGGVARLQPAFHISHLLELRESLQKVENPATTLQVPAESDVEARHCLVHEDKELELYCETCDELLCYICALKGGKHHDHDYEQLNQAFKKYQKEITPSLEPMEKQVAIIRKALAQLDACCGEVSDQQAATAHNIHMTFRRLREALDVRETELINELDRATQKKLKVLAAQRDQVETTLAQLCSCLNFIRESLQPGNEEDVLMMKSNTIARVKELATPIQPDMLEPCTKADVIFSALADLTVLCKNYGQVFSLGQPDLRVTGDGAALKVGTIGERSTAILQAINFAGETYEEPIKILECELVSEITGTRENYSLKRIGLSQYEIDYQPTIKGRHQLHIKAEGQHIRGSPFSVAVKAPVKQLGTPILTVDGLIYPLGIAINQEGEMVVTEEGGCCVSVLDRNGQRLRSFGERGSGPGQFQSPRGVAVDGDGNILVADTCNNRIQKFTAAGHFLTGVGTCGNGSLQRQMPCDIAFNSNNGKVYVTDRDNHCVRVLNSYLGFSGIIGKKGSNKGEFRFPQGIACGSTGEVYVADSGNHRIQVFTAKGKFLRMFSEIGMWYHLNKPVGVAIDACNVVYVSEDSGRCISVFTSMGRFVTSFGAVGETPGVFNYPSGLAVDDCGVVFVCNQDCYRIQLY